MSEEKKTITIENAGCCSAYELRQELLRRKAFDFKDPDSVNFKILLHRLMVELVKDKQQLDNEKSTKALEENVQKLDSAKADRERKKREAIERSKARQQSDPDYFKKRTEANRKGKLEVEEKRKQIAEAVECASCGEDLEDSEGAFQSDDPFRSNPGRSKIFVK